MSKILLDLYPSNNIEQVKVINPQNLQQIDKINGDLFSYNEFYNKYMINNIPVIFTSISNNWHCKQQWITNISQNLSIINFDNLKREIDNFRVPVANCSKRYFDSHEKSEINFYDFLDIWKSKIFNNEINLEKENLYLKDWHLKSVMPTYNFYDVPKYFASDWLNEYLIDNGKDDYRFVYMGPRGTWTSFHSDVFSSFSWSTNICGQKKWLLLPPGEEIKLKDSLNNLPFSIDENILLKNNVIYFSIIQNENESIFVPTNWYHQVWNQTDTISINHNWFNACNIEKIWLSLAKNMKNVIKEIQDCITMDNFIEHCQIMLRASFGMNYYDFLDLLEYIEKKSLMAIFQSNHYDDDRQNVIDVTIKFDLYKMNSEHFYVDLRAIRRVVKLMKNDQVVRDNMEFLNRCLHLENETHLFDGIVCEK